LALPPPSQPVSARPAVRYALALAAPVAALLAQFLLSHWLGQHMPMLLFTLAVSAVAFQAGLGPGLLSTGVCTALTLVAWWSPGTLPFTIPKNGEAARLFLFVLTGVVTSVMADSLHRARNSQRDLARRALQDASALRGSEELLRSITENSTDIIFAKDREGRFVFMNRAGYDASGLTPAEMLGHTDFELHRDPVQSEAYRVVDERVMATRRTETAEEFYTSPTTGEQRCFLTTKTPRLDARGHVIGVVGVVHDITQHKHDQEALRVSEERMRLAAQAGGFGTFVRNFETSTFWWSDELKQIAGLPTDCIVTQPVTDRLIHPDDRARIQAARARWFAPDGPDGYEDEYRWVRPDGEVRWVFVKGRTLFSGAGPQRKATVAMGAVIDITLRKAAEQALRDSNLTAQAARVSAERARESAEAASRAKDDFLAALSHELRNPLNPVLLLASERERDFDQREEVREDWITVRKNIALEARLIDDLLDLTSIVRGKLAVSVGETDVHAVLHEALETVRAELEEKRLVLTLDLAATERTIWADAVRLQQIFWNILKNAVKFTPANGSITVRTRASAEREVSIEITDSGLGMIQAELSRVFDAFAQGDHAEAGGAHRFGGLGLGLTITKQLVMLHNGRIRATSPGRGGGSTFLVDLPLIKTPPVAAEESTPAGRSEQPPVASRRGEPRRKLLLVEDHEATRQTLARLLDRRGYDVVSAGTLAEARTAAGEQQFEILVSDLGLPDGNGHTLMAELQASRPGAVRGIALSGYGMEEDLVRSRDAGFSEHLIKPVEIQVLEQALRRLVE
jgi:PAS domain S-box-containing protein